MGLTEFRPGRPGAFAGGFLGTRHQTTRRREILPPWEAIALLARVAQHTAEDLADAGHRVQEIQGLGIRVLGGGDEGKFPVATQLIGRPDERESDVEACLPRRIGNALGAPVAIGFVGDLVAEGREGILAVGVLARGEEFAALACQVQAAPPPVAGGAPLGRRDSGLGEHPAAQEHGNWMGVELVVFGLAPMEGLHGEGMPEAKRETVVSTQVGKPGPRSTCMRQR
jgi:hypothetical protein